MISQRHLFDIPDDIAYFNCAYYSPQLNESPDSQRGNSVRFSPHLHISEYDMNRLLETLDKLVR